MIHFKSIYNISFGVLVIAAMVSFRAKNDYPGTEYSPNMYHSVAYEPLSQITDKEAGRWVTSKGDNDPNAEFYNSNVNNPKAMNMRLPVKGTISRREYLSQPDSVSNVYYSFRGIHKDSIDFSENLKNPIVVSSQVLEEGQTLYVSFCSSCHGEGGKGDGLVGAQYKGVPNYSAGRYATMTPGHIFHTITHGKGRMWPHGSQISPDERWKIVHFVQTLQKQ